MVAVGGTGCRALLKLPNTLRLHDAHHLHGALDRPADVGLLTVSNHVATIDDPGLLAAMVPVGSLFRGGGHFRWGVCAEDVCFRPGSVIERFAAVSQVLPIVRGGGVWQPELLPIIDKLREGRWVHFFPEGIVRQDGHVRPFRRGVGRIVAALAGAAADQPPEPAASSSSAPSPAAERGAPSARPHEERLLVIPFYHEGCERIQPTTPTSTTVFSRTPEFGVPVHVIFGEPLDLRQAVGRHLDLAREPPFDRRPELVFELVAHVLEEEVRALQAELHRRLAREEQEAAAAAGRESQT